jgi:thiol-disulfide isomerase/thioredoxin
MTAKFLFAMLYAAITLGANPVFAEPVNLSKISELRAGDMKKLLIHAEPKKMSSAGFLDENGDKVTLKSYKGKVVLLNFWATWCPPCLAEMPSIDALQADIGGDTFTVVTVATGRNPLPAIQSFYKKAGITNLPILRDPKQKFARANGVFGLPTTLILNANGKEIGRMQGDADWYSDEALTLIKALLPKSEAETDS